ncbi:hypothetical protein VTN77DRAFT_4576 [Rasamsonia byssochlamydoides]|uniref:uncharacterized protein n=1 Tax=Rasamsonia byssochlamydoides TaxID=89139 RepID=UPI0037438FDB
MNRSAADELLNHILSFLVAEPDATKIRDHLHISRPPFSQATTDGDEVFKLGERSDLDRYRLVCKRFMRIATPWKFRRFVLRFSREGFQRLNELMNMQLAGHTRYFTYMVRPFYRGRGWERFLKELSSDYPLLFKVHMVRLADQNALVENGCDLMFLKRALVSFSSLQEIKLLRLQDKADEDMLERLRNGNTEEEFSLDWEPACARAVRNLGVALLGSSCHSVRFFGPQISAEAALKLLQTPSFTISAVGARLTCLDVNFHSSRDVTTIMSNLSEVFREFFLAARNLIIIHIGFPAKSPVDFQLEDIFHRLQWESLRSLGIQGWRLDSAEIIDISLRHRFRLRELRMPCVYLRQGSRWRDILSALHGEMEELESVDLRDIDYANHFDAEIMNGVEVPPQQVEREDTIPSVSTTHQGRSEAELRQAQQLSLEELRALTADDLGDNGERVEREQWPLWEAWVTSRARSKGGMSRF